MSAKTGIQWTDHTFNPWWGCVEVSPECDNCYARTLATQRGLSVWGPGAPRKGASERTWAEPITWNRIATKKGERRRVFCLSMGDVLEEHEQLGPWRERLWDVIRATPALDWQLLSKRPQNFRKMVPDDLLASANVWPGTTCGTASSRWRLDKLAALECAGPRWVSYEPALDAVDFGPWLPRIEWVIAGGESGSGARPFDPAWARDVVEACRAAGVAPFVKQLGSRPIGLKLRHPHGADMVEWPEDLRVREWPR